MQNTMAAIQEHLDMWKNMDPAIAAIQNIPPYPHPAPPPPQPPPKNEHFHERPASGWTNPVGSSGWN
jgi:hypothetical protein